MRAPHLEPDVVVDDALVAEVRSALQACARFAHRTGAAAVEQIVAQDTPGRGALCNQTRACQAAYGAPSPPMYERPQTE